MLFVYIYIHININVYIYKKYKSAFRSALSAHY